VRRGRRKRVVGERKRRGKERFVRKNGSRRASAEQGRNGEEEDDDARRSWGSDDHMILRARGDDELRDCRVGGVPLPRSFRSRSDIPLSLVADSTACLLNPSVLSARTTGEKQEYSASWCVNASRGALLKLCRRHRPHRGSDTSGGRGGGVHRCSTRAHLTLSATSTSGLVACCTRCCSNVRPRFRRVG
jgi:hypothetical protein